MSTCHRIRHALLAAVIWFSFVLLLVQAASAQTCPTPTALTSGTSVATATDASFYSITPGLLRWSAVGVRAGDGKDWNLNAYDGTALFPSCVAGPLATSAGSGIDFAVTDWRIRPANSDYLVAGTGFGTGTSARVQYEQMFYEIQPNRQFNHIYFTADDVLKLQEMPLLAGIRYFFEIWPTTGSDGLKFYLFAPAPSAAGWIPKSNRVLEGGPLVSGGGNLFEYTPSVDGYYALVVTNESGIAGDFLIGAKQCPISTSILTSKVPFFSVMLDEWPGFTPPAHRWGVVGTRGDYVLYGLDIAPGFRDQNGQYALCTDSVAAEQYSGLGAKVIAGDFRYLPLRFYTARMSSQGQPFTIPGGYTEWEDGQDSLVVNAPPTFVSPPEHNVIDTWGVKLVHGGTYNFQLTPNGGATAAYKMLIFANTFPEGTPYWAARPDAIGTDPSFISVAPGQTDLFCVVVVNDNGGTGGYSIQVTSTLVDAGAGPAVPRISRIRGLSPNPSSGLTRIDYELGRSGRASLRIADVSGRVVAELAPVSHTGAGSLTWDGRTGDGRQASAGVYFVALCVDGVAQDRAKMIVLR